MKDAEGERRDWGRGGGGGGVRGGEEGRRGGGGKGCPEHVFCLASFLRLHIVHLHY